MFLNSPATGLSFQASQAANSKIFMHRQQVSNFKSTSGNVDAISKRRKKSPEIALQSQSKSVLNFCLCKQKKLLQGYVMQFVISLLLLWRSVKLFCNSLFFSCVKIALESRLVEMFNHSFATFLLNTQRSFDDL